MDFTSQKVLLAMIGGACLVVGVVIWIIKAGVREGIQSAGGIPSRPPPHSGFPVEPLADVPGLYLVRGVDRATKMDTSWRVQADGPANAKVKAELEGIVVTSVDRESDGEAMPPPAGVDRPARYHITGRVRATGGEISTYIHALSEADARAKAEHRGLVVKTAARG